MRYLFLLITLAILSGCISTPPIQETYKIHKVENGMDFSEVRRLLGEHKEIQESKSGRDRFYKYCNYRGLLRTGRKDANYETYIWIRDNKVKSFIHNKKDTEPKCEKDLMIVKVNETIEKDKLTLEKLPSGMKLLNFEQLADLGLYSRKNEDMGMFDIDFYTVNTNDKVAAEVVEDAITISKNYCSEKPRSSFVGDRVNPRPMYIKAKFNNDRGYYNLGLTFVCRDSQFTSSNAHIYQLLTDYSSKAKDELKEQLTQETERLKLRAIQAQAAAAKKAAKAAQERNNSLDDINSSLKNIGRDIKWWKY